MSYDGFTQVRTKRRLWKGAAAVVALATILNASSLQAVLTVESVGATGSTCPTGNVKLNVGSGYEYTDHSATVSVIPGTDGEHNRVTWSPASGFVVTGVCMKIGGSNGGTLKYPSPSLGQAGPYAYDISHVVLTTKPGDTPSVVPNPPLGQSCGLDIALVVDRSGSMDSGEMSQVKSAMTTFVDAFTGTPTQFSLTKFETNASVVQSFTDDFGLMKSKISGLPSSGDGNTNWDAALAKAFSTFDPRPTKSDLIVIATDGSPNRFGDPATGTFDWNLGLSNAVSRANAIKTAGTRIVVIGIGSDPTDPDYPNTDAKLQAISGSVIAPPAAIDATIDVVKTNFSDLADAMAGLAQGLCGGKILVQKQLDLDGDGSIDLDGSQPDPRLVGYTFDVSPNIPENQVTDETGSLEFSVANGTYSLTELQHSGMRLVSAECTDGDAAVGNVDLNSQTISGLSVSTDETVVCTFVNAPTDGQLKVMKQVIGGAYQASDWMLHVKSGNQDVDGSPQPGSNEGTTYSLPAGEYTISETGPNGYAASFSSGCPNGQVAVSPGQETVCTVTNTLIPEYGLTLVKSAPAMVHAGGMLTYTLTWAIGGNTPATDVVISDPLPENTSFVSADHEGTEDNGTVVWNLGTQPAGVSGSVSLTVAVAKPLANGTVLTNSACIDSEESEQVCDPAKTTVISSPSISIVKSNNVSSFTTPGKTVRYTVTVTNAKAATDAANDVVLTDVLPAGFTFQADGASTKSFALGTIEPGSSMTKSYDVVVSANQKSGTYVNTATADGSNTDSVSATSSVEVRVPAVEAASTNPDLSITKTIPVKTANPNEIITYTLTVKNTGDADAENVVVKDTLPKDLSFASYQGRSHTWKLGTLKPGATVSIQYDVRVESDAKRGTYVNVAVVSADDVKSKKATASLDVLTPAVLGAATLPVTGSGPADYAVFVIGAALIALGVYGLKRRNDSVRPAAQNFITGL